MLLYIWRKKSWGRRRELDNTDIFSAGNVAAVAITAMPDGRGFVMYVARTSEEGRDRAAEGDGDRCAEHDHQAVVERIGNQLREELLADHRRGVGWGELG